MATTTPTTTKETEFANLAKDLSDDFLAAQKQLSKLASALTETPLNLAVLSVRLEDLIELSKALQGQPQMVLIEDLIGQIIVEPQESAKPALKQDLLRLIGGSSEVGGLPSEGATDEVRKMKLFLTHFNEQFASLSEDVGLLVAAKKDAPDNGMAKAELVRVCALGSFAVGAIVFIVGLIDLAARFE